MNHGLVQIRTSKLSTTCIITLTHTSSQSVLKFCRSVGMRLGFSKRAWFCPFL